MWFINVISRKESESEVMQDYFFDSACVDYREMITRKLGAKGIAKFTKIIDNYCREYYPSGAPKNFEELKTILTKIATDFLYPASYLLFNLEKFEDDNVVFYIDKKTSILYVDVKNRSVEGKFLRAQFHITKLTNPEAEYVSFIADNKSIFDKTHYELDIRLCPDQEYEDDEDDAEEEDDFDSDDEDEDEDDFDFDDEDEDEDDWHNKTLGELMDEDDDEDDDFDFDDEEEDEEDDWGDMTLGEIAEEEERKSKENLQNYVKSEVADILRQIQQPNRSKTQPPAQIKPASGSSGYRSPAQPQPQPAKPKPLYAWERAELNNAKASYERAVGERKRHPESARIYESLEKRAYAEYMRVLAKYAGRE